ncbi:MAG: LysR family transcriptional regulator [Alphaproteobacteria bacterium]
MKFQLRLLETFVTVAETQSLYQASLVLNRTIPSISMTLKQLEGHLGHPLFLGERKNKLTPLGEFVYHRAQRALQERKQAIEDIELFTKGQLGSVRIAAVPSIAQTFLPDILGQFMDKDIQFEVRDTNSLGVINAIEQGIAEFGLASVPYRASHLNLELLFEEHLYLLCHKNHPLTQQDRVINWADIQDEKFIMSDLCRKISSPEMNEIAAKSKIYIYNMLSLLAFVEQGLGITFIPKTTPIKNTQCVSLPFNDTSISRKIYLISKKNRFITPLAQNIITIIREKFIDEGIS